MKNQSCTRWAVVVLLFLVVTSCEQEPFNLRNPESVDCGGCNGTPGGGTVTTAPYISSFTPGYGRVTDQVAIYGGRFSTVPSNNIVKFNGVQALVVLATTSLLIAEVPAFASTGKISVSVSGQQALSATDFEVLKDIPRNGLVLFYPFTNTYNDFSGNSRHLVALSPERNPSATQDRFNKSGQAIYLDGIDDFLRAENVSISHPITVGFWTKYSSIDYGSILGTKGGDGNLSNGFAITTVDYLSGHSLVTYVDTPVDYMSNTALLPTTTSSWIFLAISFDGNTFKIYKNGLLHQTIIKPGSITSALYFFVGLSATGHYAGGVDDITVYNRVLSDSEIVQLHQQTISKY